MSDETYALLFQLFTLELYLRGLNVLARNQTLSTRPQFAVGRLRAASLFDARVYASNRRGRSDAVALRVSTVVRRGGGAPPRSMQEEEEEDGDKRPLAAAAAASEDAILEGERYLKNLLSHQISNKVMN